MDSVQTMLPSDFSPLSLSSIDLCQYLGVFSGRASGYKYIQVSKEVTDDAKLQDAINQHLKKEMIESARKDGITLDMKDAKFVCVAIGADEDPYEEPSDPEDQSVRLVLNHEYRFSPIGVFYSDSKGNWHVAFRGTQTVKEIDYSTGRYRRWLNDDKKTIKSVLGVYIPGYMRAGTAEFLYRPVPIFGPVIDQLRYGLTCAKPNAPLYGAAHSLGGTLLSALVPLASMMGKFTFFKGTLLGSLNTFDDVGIKAVMNSAKIKVTNIWDKSDPIPTWGWGKTPFSVLGDRVTIDTGKLWIGAHPMSSYVPWIKNQLKG